MAPMDPSKASMPTGSSPADFAPFGAVPKASAVDKDYFPLAPMITVAMLWWGVAWPAYFSMGAWMIICTAALTGLGYATYRWLCGPGARAALLGVGLAAVFCLTWWRSSDLYRAVSLGGYVAMLLLAWVSLKFGGGIHVRLSNDPEGPPRMLHDDVRGYTDDIGDYSNYMPVFEREAATVEEVWTTVSTVFQPRYPAAWSAEVRRRRHLEAVIVGLVLIISGLLALHTGGLHLLWFSLNRIGLALFLIAAGWSVVGIAYQLRRAGSNAREERRSLCPD